MALLNKVSGDLELYIGGLFTLRRKEALKTTGITHVLSVLRLPLDPNLFSGFVHKVVEVDDVDDENLLEYLPSCLNFIQSGLDAGGAVLVHCAAGKSRSATCVCAYLMKHDNLDPMQALARLRETRAFAEPNPGFMKQLELFHQMGLPENVDDHPMYQRWLYQRELEASREIGQAPEADKIRFEDEYDHAGGAVGSELRCRKCRRALATSQYLVEHNPRQAPVNSGSFKRDGSTPTCSHYFLDPLSWMRPELEQGKLDGRLECPKCKTNVGKYAWQGMQCSCGDWVLPGISLAKGKIDEVKSRTPASTAAMGIRLPATDSNARKPEQGNL